MNGIYIELWTAQIKSLDIMTPEEFEENARIITGDPTWSLSDDDVTVEEVAHTSPQTP